MIERLMRARGLPGLAALLACAVVLLACGESDEEKAQSAVCDARADIQKEVDELADLTITRASIDQVREHLTGIRDGLERIAAEQENLEPDRHREVEEAGKHFRSQLETTAMDLVSGATSGDEAAAGMKAYLTELVNSFRQAYAPLECD